MKSTFLDQVKFEINEAEPHQECFLTSASAKWSHQKPDDTPMNLQTEILLKTIGEDLDRKVFPSVHDSGLVWPARAVVISQPPGQEIQIERQTTAPRTWQTGTSSSSGTSRDTRPPGATASLLGEYQSDGFLAEIAAVQAAYPGTQVWEVADGFWLYAQSHLLPGLNRPAGFLVGLSLAKRCVRAWAFWSAGVVGADWIGPRHTNFPDGSICAFEPRDGTWVFGESLVTLLDLYSVWALRQLHLERLSRWPGPQAVHFPYERILEVAGDEHCPCGFTGRSYAECCQPVDLAANRLAIAVNLVCISSASMRFPPRAIRDFVLYRKFIPSIADLV